MPPVRVFAAWEPATADGLLLTDRVLAHRVDITDAVHVMTPVIVTSATLLVVIAVLAALFPLDTQVAPGAFETIGVATTAIIGNHCVREWPERQGEAAHTAPVRRVVMLSILAVVCAVLVLFASGRLRSPWLGCRVIAAAIGGFDIAHTAWLQLQWHYYPESMPSLDTPIMYTTGERRGPPTLKAYAFPVWFFAVAVTMSPGVRRFISRRTGLRVLAVSLGTLRTTELEALTRDTPSPVAARVRPSPGAVTNAATLAAAEPLLQAAVDAAEAADAAPASEVSEEVNAVGAHRLASESSVPSSFGRRFEREWVATNANEVQMSLEDDIRRACAPVSAEAAARATAAEARAAGASAPEAAVARASPAALRAKCRRRRARRREPGIRSSSRSSNPSVVSEDSQATGDDIVELLDGAENAPPQRSPSCSPEGGARGSRGSSPPGAGARLGLRRGGAARRSRRRRRRVVGRWRAGRARRSARRGGRASRRPSARQQREAELAQEVLVRDLVRPRI